jgi:hypothetical protein
MRFARHAALTQQRHGQKPSEPGSTLQDLQSIPGIKRDNSLRARAFPPENTGYIDLSPPNGTQ